MTDTGSDANAVVSVLMPFHNAERTIALAIRSIIAQTFRRWEMVLIDDGSTDGGLTIARSFQDKRIRIAGDRTRRGISARLNAAVAEVRTELVCRMDADDVAFPGRLERQVAVLRGDPGLDLVASSIVVFEGSGELAGMMRVEPWQETIAAKPWRGFFFPHPAWLGRARWFLANPYATPDDGAEDQGLLYRAHRSTRLAGIDEVLLAYREDGRTLMKQLGRRVAFWKAIGRQAWESGAWRDFALLAMRQPALMAGDFVYAAGWRSLRRRLTPVPPGFEAEWRNLWASLQPQS